MFEEKYNNLTIGYKLGVEQLRVYYLIELLW